MEDRRARAEDEGRPLRDELRRPGPVRFEITVTERPGTVRLEICGELDVLTQPRLSTELNRLIRRSSADVVVDLRRTEFIDSIGLQALLRTQRQLGQSGRKLSVVCDDGPVRRVIEMTRLGEILGLVSGDETAGG